VKQQSIKIRVIVYKGMNDGFDGVSIPGQRREKDIVEENEDRLLTEAERRGIEPIDDKSRGFEILEDSFSPDSEQDLNDYIEDLQGFRRARVVLRAGGDEHRRPQQIHEEVSINLDFDNQDFLDIYTRANEDLEINSAAFSLVGYSDTAFEAYQDSLPMIAFKVGGEVSGGFTASYRGNNTVIESMHADSEDEIRTIYETLVETGAEYAGVVMEGDKQDAWVISDYGNRDLREMI
jgi:hypothetical protein